MIDASLRRHYPVQVVRVRFVPISAYGSPSVNMIYNFAVSIAQIYGLVKIYETVKSV